MGGNGLPMGNSPELLTGFACQRSKQEFRRTIVKLIQRMLVVAAVVAVAAVWVLPAQADLLSLYGSDAYTDASATTWAGSASYSDLGALVGTVEYVVFPPNGFPTIPGSTYAPPAGELVYAYQVENTGSSDASTLGVSFGSNSEYDSFGSFPLTGLNGAGILPDPVNSGFVLNRPFVTAHYYFPPPSILQGNSSAGLAFASVDTPENWYGSLVDSGLGSGTSPLPGPSTTAVPEPSIVILLAASAILLSVGRRFLGDQS